MNSSSMKDLLVPDGIGIWGWDIEQRTEQKDNKKVEEGFDLRFRIRTYISGFRAHSLRVVRLKS